LDINYSPWYEAAVLFRKKSINENWKDLVERVSKELPSLN
jgi:hypothetical protein